MSSTSLRVHIDIGLLSAFATAAGKEAAVTFHVQTHARSRGITLRRITIRSAFSCAKGTQCWVKKCRAFFIQLRAIFSCILCNKGAFFRVSGAPFTAYAPALHTDV